MALLVGAGLFTKSLFNVSRVDLGLKIDNVVTFGISPALNGYTPQRSLALFERLEDELGAVPGVTGVAAAHGAAAGGQQLGQRRGGGRLRRPGRTPTPTPAFNEVGPGYFRTLGVPLLAGREFTRADAAGAPKVAIVNEAFAKKFNLGRNAVGKRMANRGNRQLDIEIVGLVQNAKYSEVKDPVAPQFFRPYRQDDSLGFLTFYVRTSLEAGAAASPRSRRSSRGSTRTCRSRTSGRCRSRCARTCSSTA